MPDSPIHELVSISSSRPQSCFGTPSTDTIDERSRNFETRQVFRPKTPLNFQFKRSNQFFSRQSRPAVEKRSGEQAEVRSKQLFVFLVLLIAATPGNCFCLINLTENSTLSPHCVLHRPTTNAEFDTTAALNHELGAYLSRTIIEKKRL